MFESTLACSSPAFLAALVDFSEAAAASACLRLYLVSASLATIFLWFASFWRDSLSLSWAFFFAVSSFLLAAALRLDSLRCSFAARLFVLFSAILLIFSWSLRRAAAMAAFMALFFAFLT